MLLLAAAPSRRGRERPRPTPALGQPIPYATPPGRGLGTMAGSLFSGPAEGRGLVVFLPPWVPQGAAWFYRHGRVEAVRAAGWDALVADLAGLGAGRSGPGFFDREIEVLLHDARRLVGSRPLVVWGISSGGYWAHPAIARGAPVDAAVFEDVAAHLLLWAHREAPRLAHFYRVYERLLRQAWAFLDIKRHAPWVAPGRGLWISGDLDRGVLPEETRELARLSGGRALIVPHARHLGAMRVAPELVVREALATFALP